MRLLLLGGRAPSPRAALDVRAHCPGVPAAGGGTHPAGLRPVLCRSANRTRALWGAERDVTAGGAAPSAPAGPRGGPPGWAGPDLRGPDPKAALSADPSCSFPLPGAEASSSSDPARSSACVTTGGRRASCTRRPLPAHAPPGTPGWGTLRAACRMHAHRRGHLAGGRSRPPGLPGAGWQWAGPGRQGKKHRRARRHWVGTGRGPARCRTTHAARDAVPHEERYRRTLWAMLLPGAGSRVLRGHPRSPRWSHHL